jgi:hypothetical protein
VVNPLNFFFWKEAATSKCEILLKERSLETKSDGGERLACHVSVSGAHRRSSVLKPEKELA